MGIQRLEVRVDSNLAVSQINGDFDAKDPKMAAYRNAILKMSAWFEGLEFIMWFEKTIKRQMSSPASVLNATLSHLHILGKVVQAIRSMGRGVRQY